MILKRIKEQKINSIIKEVNKENIIVRIMWLTIGCFMVAFAFNVFFLQYDIVCTGVTGISIILKDLIEPSELILLVNVILLVISYFALGKEKTTNSIIGSLMLPIFINLTKSLVPLIDLGDLEITVIVIIGAVLTGFGNGLVFKNGFTTGGTDIINQIVSKYTKISVGTSMLMVDGLVVLSSKFVYGWQTVLYGFVILYIISFIIDKAILGISQSKAFYIVTNKEEEVRDFLITINNAGVTLLNVKGGYSNDKKVLLLAVIPTRNYFVVKEGLRAIDKNVFFLVCDAYEVNKKGQAEND